MPRHPLTPEQAQRARDNLAKANATKAANRALRLAPGYVAPPKASVALAQAPETGPSQTEAQTSLTLESVRGVPALARDAMLDAIGYTAAKRQRTLKNVVDTLVNNLDATKVIFSNRGTIREEVPDGLVRNKAAEILGELLGLKVSRQPEAMRLKSTTEFVRPSFARPRAVIDRPVTDSESPTDSVKTS